MIFDGPNDTRSRPSDFPESEIRAIARLMGSVIAAKGGHAAKKRRLLDGLARIVNADGWSWTLHAQPSNQPPMLLDFMKAGFTARRFSIYQKFAAARLDGPIGTVTANYLRELLPGRDTGFGPALFSSASHPGQGSSLIGIFRKATSGGFTNRETAICELVLSEIPWLHAQGFPSEPTSRGRGLSCRLAAVLELLRKGHSRKQIADDLGISLNTVHGYIRMLYLHFKVNSHSALLQTCLHGDPSPPPNERSRIAG